MKEHTDSLGRIPQELEQFMMGSSTSLLIKGAPGTGKTTLALEVLRLMSGEVKCHYFSTRSSIKKLKEQFPWIERELEKIGFEPIDARLGTPQHLITIATRILREVGGCLVFDSWDSISDELSPKERNKVERTLVSIADSCGAKIVFVSENLGGRSLEYLSDGIVTLRQIWFFGSGKRPYARIRRRSAREIELEKLRGVPIYQRNYLFTLYGGRFTCIPPYRPARVQASEEAVPDLNDWYMSTGIRELDEACRGLPRGRLFLVEVGGRVGIRCYPLLFEMIWNVVLSGRGALMLSSLIPIPEFLKGIREHKGSGEFKRVGSFKRIFLSQTYEETAVSYVREYERLRRIHKEVIEFIDLNALESRFGPRKAISFLLDAASRAFESRVPVVLIAREGIASLDVASRLSSAHIALDDLNGALVLYGISPRSRLYGLIVVKGRHSLIDLM